VTYISSQSKYIFFLDSDDLLVPRTLQVMSGYLDSYPDVGLLTCQIQEIDERGTPYGSTRRCRWVPGRFFPRQLADDQRETPFITFFCGTGQGPFALFRTSVFLRTKGFEETFSAHEDTDMFCQMALAAKVHHLGDRFYLKRKHGAQLTANYTRVQEAGRLFRKKWDHFPSRNIEEEKLLREATKYYHRTHAPWRNLKVACKAFMEFVRAGKRCGFWWWLQLWSNAVLGFLGRYQKW
jgi:GT2 family glycosyltransferase